ncbi:14036_t:CDS:2, partial [Racocetra fulgida]
MKEEEEQLKKLKRHAHNQQKSEMKKLWALEDDNAQWHISSTSISHMADILSL